MPIATPKQYAAMLDAAQKGDYAYPAVNVTSITTINAALKAFADSKSDGIIQFSTGGGQFAAGLNVKDAVHGCIVLAEAAHRLAEKYDILVGLHSDHCQPEKAEGFLKPLIEETARRRANGQTNLFQSHMLDASILPLEENIAISKEYLELCAKNEIILEVEAGVVGGEEDGAAAMKICHLKNFTQRLKTCLAFTKALTVSAATCLLPPSEMYTVLINQVQCNFALIF